MCVILLLMQLTGVRNRVLANFFFSLLKFQVTSDKHFFLYKNEGNNTKVENKVSGRVRVGVGGALLSQ